MRQEEVHVAGAVEQRRLGGFAQAAQAGARVEDEEAVSGAAGEAGRLAPVTRHPADRPQECHAHRSLTFRRGVRTTCV
jgi:hypothetical protein